jgi:protein-S-isoprenylcysteine O-methyltransferase Ste14
MTTAAARSDRRASSAEITRLGGVDISSWLSWACYGLGFGLTVRLAPEAIGDLQTFGVGAVVLMGAVGAFLGLVLVIQREMSVALSNTAFGEPRKLTTTGFFAVSRNPMYVAFLLPLLSLAIYSPLSALAAATLYVTAMNTLIISNEEDVLKAGFGAQYRRYCLATPRWLVW